MRIIFIVVFSLFVAIITCNPILIVISFDGFRNDYISPKLTPNLFSIATNGVKGHMKSQFITKTFPNHQSIATGFYEENHGIVSDHFFDPKYNQTFDVDKSPDYWWTESDVTPIWTANQLLGGYSGVNQWPGGQVEYKNQATRYLQTYNHSISWHSRINTIMTWLTDDYQPANCVFAYFNQPDSTAHQFGPFSKEVRQQVRNADDIIGYLIQELNKFKLSNRTNLIVLSDHGFAEITAERVINLNTIINPNLYDWYGGSPVWSIEPKAGKYDLVYQTLLSASKTTNFTIYKKDEIPEHYHYKNNRRIQSLLMVSDLGWDVYQDMYWKPKGYPIWGNHGWDNSDPSMQPLFVAIGPAFKSGYEHQNAFLNIDLYPLMLNILKLLPSNKFPSNGNISNVYDLLNVYQN